MFSQELEQAISKAYQHARRERHRHLGVEHLALAVLKLESVRSTLEPATDLEQLTSELQRLIDDTTEFLDAESEQDTQPTDGFQRVLQRAVYWTQISGTSEVDAAQILVAIQAEKSQVVAVFHRHNITQAELRTMFAIPQVPEGPNRPHYKSTQATFNASVASYPEPAHGTLQIETRLQAIEDRLAAIERILSEKK